MGLSCEDYKKSPTNEKMAIIEKIYGVRRFTTEVKVRDMACLVWTRMSHAQKAAWKERADILNQRYVTGLFQMVPDSVPRDRDAFLCECFREESSCLKKCFKTALIKKGMKNIATRHIRIPHKVKIGTLAFRGITVSPAFRKCLVLGTELKDLEKVGFNKEPLVLHFATKERFAIFFAIDDIEYGKYVDKKVENTYYLTSLCILERDGSGASVKAYGWTETDSTVTFIYRNSRTSTRLVTFPRPRFVTSVVKKNDRNYRKREYEFHSEYVDGLKIVSYVPVCVYLSSKCMRNFKLLSARLCVKETIDGHIILPNLSS